MIYLKLTQKVLVVCYSKKILFLAVMANRTTFLCKTNCDTACALETRLVLNFVFSALDFLGFSHDQWC